MKGACAIWCSWAPLRCKLFAWLALQARIWASERRHRHGLQDDVAACFTCLQEKDEINHIVLGCVFARQVWHGCFNRLGVEIEMLETTDSLHSWWLVARQRIPGQDRRGFDTLAILVCWRLWKQRNVRCFQELGRQFSVTGLVDQIVADWNQWGIADLGGRSTFARVVH
jgi:hypothetical protein